jgi:hypothetical protein
MGSSLWAPEEVKIARFIPRSASGEAITIERRAQLEAEARRLAQHISGDQKSALADCVLTKALFRYASMFRYFDLYSLLRWFCIVALLKSPLAAVRNVHGLRNDCVCEQKTVVTADTSNAVGAR